MLEADTRKELIDKRLALAGWQVSNLGQVVQEFPIDLAASGGSDVERADYVLLLHGQVAAVVEAKKTCVDASIGREQALQYAQHIQAERGGELPLVLYTNGYDIYLWEYGVYAPLKVMGFPTRDDLEWLLERRRHRKPLSVELIDKRIVERPYQFQSIRAVLEGVEARRRKFLLVQATGTGKTRVAVALVDVLRRAKWAKRILFLVDRIALRDQALDAFEEFIPNESRWPHKDESAFATNRRLYVDTYPSMLNRIQRGTTAAEHLSPHFFDLVIADESHRSIYNTYRQVLDYFCAIRVGLTATPTNYIDHDTFALFECPDGDPSFSYSYEEAVRERYLNPFEVLRIRSRFQVDGIHGGLMSTAERARLMVDGIDPDDVDFDGTELERTVTNAGTNALIIREFMEESIKDPSGTLPGKSIVFAMGKAHARRLEEIFNALYPEHAGRLARVLVSADPRVYGKGGLLDQFKTQDMPRVAISVDMLDTGVDVPEIVNLLFAKPVYSYTKFWQMIGRGTRVLPPPAKIRPWCTHKDKFLIVDCWGSFERFKIDPQGRIPQPQVPLPVRLFVVRLDRLEAALAVGDVDAQAAAVAGIQSDLGELPANNVVVLENRAVLERIAAPAFWLELSAEDVGYLRTVVAPLMRARSAADDKRLRFETAVTEAATLLVAGVPDADRFQQVASEVMAHVEELPLGVNVVFAQAEQIRAALDPVWWANATERQLDELAQNLGTLMRFRQSRRMCDVTKLDLPDTRLIKEFIEFGPAHERLTTQAYRERLEVFVRNLVSENKVLQRIQAGEPVADSDARPLADLLAAHDPYATEDVLRKVYDHKTARFLQFIRHILGLEKLASWSDTVQQSFDTFIAQHNTFSEVQIQFLRTLQTFLLQTGAVEKRHLVQAPFTNLHPSGVRGLFRRHEIDEILEFAERLVA